jgi:hypothetical protein
LVTLGMLVGNAEFVAHHLDQRRHPAPHGPSGSVDAEWMVSEPNRTQAANHHFLNPIRGPLSNAWKRNLKGDVTG